MSDSLATLGTKATQEAPHAAAHAAAPTSTHMPTAAPPTLADTAPDGTAAPPSPLPDLAPGGVDIVEDTLADRYPDVLQALLKDHTLSQRGHDRNISWATSDYQHLGPGFRAADAIEVERITGRYGHLIMPRVRKDADIQQGRKRDKAEIFTPAWIVNAQLNLVDEAWFGAPSPFNHEHTDTHTWTTLTDPIRFPEGKTWHDYVRAPRLEITCGEGPYLTSRYDAATGQPIAPKDRMGLLDRKLRVVSENVHLSTPWLKAAQEALQSVYGYEWAGDSLLLAREALLCTFIDAYRMPFGQDPQERSLRFAAYIISWNVWQMDGLRGVVPDSCHDTVVPPNGDLFGPTPPPTVTPCEGCRTGNIHRHNGTYCLIRDWHARPRPGEQGPGRRLHFVDLIKG